MLAAGVGARLSPGEDAPPPKALLRFGGKSLLERHLEILRRFGFEDVTLVVGHRAELIEAELERIGARDIVRTLFNPDYRKSSLLSLWTLRDVLAAGEPVLYMDADVLYDLRVLQPLLDAANPDCVLVDRQVEPGEDPLKVCVSAGRVVDFHKQIRAEGFDFWAEWVGFARFAAGTAAALAATTERYRETGRIDVIYEEPMRDVIMGLPDPGCGIVDITGLPWIEIDFPEDLARARSEVFPRLIALPDAPPHRHRTALGPAAR
jgi:choline kinase